MANIDNAVVLKCGNVSISVERYNSIDNNNGDEVNVAAIIIDNVSNGVPNVFSNDQFDLRYICVNINTSDPLFDNIKESKLKYPNTYVLTRSAIKTLHGYSICQ